MKLGSMSRLSVIKPRFVHHDSTLITVILIAHFAEAKPGIKAFGGNRGGHPQAFQPLGDCTGLDLKHQPLANALLLMARIDKYTAHLATVVTYLITERLNEPSRLHSW